MRAIGIVVHSNSDLINPQYRHLLTGDFSLKLSTTMSPFAVLYRRINAAVALRVMGVFSSCSPIVQSINYTVQYISRPHCTAVHYITFELFMPRRTTVSAAVIRRDSFFLLPALY